ncbi:RNA-binding S4 domain-containing protein [Thalassotalea sp. PLHSN55]|uniref:RNA-binding S4 domain-containing protein n=1 Tax=Thalassotalea sp. PLHSN55 TaxID=3435888 RepID=UPI003F855965
MNEYTLVEIDQQPVELCKLLKIANLVGGGGEAKIVISEGYVLLNGEVEFQKRKKVVEHDIVEFNGEIIQVVLNDNFLPAKARSPKQSPKQTKASNKKNSSSKKTHQKAAQEISAPATSQKPKRKPISF